MKQFVIFSTLICFAAAQSFIIDGEQSKYERREKIAGSECARELNIDDEKYNKPISQDQYDEYLTNPDEETICMRACTARKLINKDLTGANNKETLYNGISKLIDIALKGGFDTGRFTREDLVNKVESCNVSEQGECEFFKCSEMHTRLFDLMFYNAIFKVKDTVFGSDE